MRSIVIPFLAVVIFVCIIGLVACSGSGPGHVTCRDHMGHIMIDTHAGDVRYHDRHGVSFYDDQGHYTRAASQYCVVTYDE